MTAAKRFISLIVFSFVALQSQAAAVLPLIELNRIPADDDEIALWALAAQHEKNLIASGKTLNEPRVEAYLNSVAGNLVGEQITGTGMKLKYLLVLDTAPRVWVYPHGTVVVHTGLLASMDNEAQLAAVLAHEFSHFLKRHAYSELVADQLPSILAKNSNRLGTAILIQDHDDNDDDAELTSRFWTDLAINGFSRTLETAADRQALKLMANAGYETNQAAVAWEQVDRNTMTERSDITLIWSIHHRPLNRIKSINATTSFNYFKPYEVPGALPYYEGVAPALIANAAAEIKIHFYDRARMQITMYLSVNPDEPIADFLIGESWRLEQPVGPDYTRRIEAYERALAKDAQFAPAWKELGMYYRFHGQIDLAHDAFNKYLLYGENLPDEGIIRGYLDTLGQTNAQR